MENGHRNQNLLPSAPTVPQSMTLYISSRVESGEEQTDSEDDEYMDDVELKSTLVAKKGGRRESVSAEQVGGDIVSIVGAGCTFRVRAHEYRACISPI